jgi:hypothetical protein
MRNDTRGTSSDSPSTVAAGVPSASSGAHRVKMSEYLREAR